MLWGRNGNHVWFDFDSLCRSTRPEHVRLGAETACLAGSGSKTLDPKAKPDKKQKNITKAIQKLLKNHRPQTK
jgi:hypothetical protein